MFILYILLALLIFGVLIFIHELGHFIVARLCGVKVLEFAIGMGPKILSWKSKKTGTAYALRLFPIGGFVNMLGENGMEAVQGDNGEVKETTADPITLINDISDMKNSDNGSDSDVSFAKESKTAPLSEMDPELAKQAYCNQNVWKRILISVAGPAMNVLLGFVMMLIVLLISGHDALLSNRIGGFFIVYENETEAYGLQKDDYLYSIDGERIWSYTDLETTLNENSGKTLDVIVQRLSEDGIKYELVTLQVKIDPSLLKAFTPSLSDATGLEKEDTVIKVNSTHVHTYNELSYEVMNQGYKPMTLTVIRNGEEMVIENVIVPTMEESGAVLGSVDFIPYRELNYDFGTILKHTWYRSLSTVKMVFDSLFGLFSGRYGVETVSGPVGITKVVGEAAQYGFTTVMNIVVVISINLGIMNLLPIPALDGCHILLYLVEAVRRKPVKKETEGLINFIGLIALLALTVIIAFKDIFTLF